MSEAFPFALLAIVVIVLAAIPWRRPHPNHEFMLELLRSQLGEERTNLNESE